MPLSSWERAQAAMDQGIAEGRYSFLQGTLPESRLPETTSFGKGFIQSALSAGGREFIGGEPSADVMRFRAGHPIGAILSGLLGFSVPAIGTMALSGGLGTALAASRIPALGRAARGVQSLRRALELRKLEGTGAAIGATAAQDVMTFAPVEAARLAGASVFEEGDIGQVAKEIPTELAFAGAFGAGRGAFRAMRPPPKVQVEGEGILARFDEYRIDDPPQLKLRAITEIRRKGVDEDTLFELNKIEGTLREAVLKQRPYDIPGTTKKAVPFVRQLEGNKSASPINKVVSQGNQHRTVRPLYVGRGGFKTDEEQMRFLAAAGLDAGMEKFMLLPRVITAKTDVGSGQVRRLLQGISKTEKPRLLSKVDRNTWTGIEADSGLTVFLRRTKGRNVQRKPGDQWLFFKTDRPDAFLGETARAAREVERRWFAMRPVVMETAVEKQVPLARGLNRLLKALGDDAKAPPPKSSREALERLGRAMVPDESLRQDIMGGAGKAKEQAKKLFAPALHRFSDYTPAVRVASVARALFNEVEARTARLYGGTRLKPGKENLYRTVFLEDPKVRGGVRPAVEALSEDDLGVLTGLWIDEIGLAGAREAGASKEVITLLERLERIDKQLIKEIDLVNQLVPGDISFTPKTNHFLISRVWRGNFRIPLRDEKGNVVGYATGKTSPGARAEADALIKYAREQGGVLKADKTHRIVDRMEDLHNIDNLFRKGREARLYREGLKAIRPARYQERKGFYGFTGQLRPINRKELGEIIRGNIAGSNRYIAQALFKHKMGADLARIKYTRPDMWLQLGDFINKLAGVRGPVNQMIERQVDNVLAPWLGSHVASRVTQAMNTTMFTLTLGAMDVGFPVLNGITFIQTGLPEIAFVLNAAPKQVARYYAYAPIATRSGVRTVGFLEPLRIAARALKEMGNPSDDMAKIFHRAQMEGVVDPKFIEAFVGERSVQSLRSQFRGVLSGKGRLTDFLLDLNKAMPAKSEEFARGHSFVVGRLIGRDFLGLKDERLYQFAREFTERTMYLYSQAARSQVLTGPIGSPFGLFKNWMVHYVANMATYSSEAAFRGNWSPFLWMMAGSGSVAGLGGIPGYFVADKMSRIYSDKTLMENLYGFFGYKDNLESAMGEDATGMMLDSMFYGLPSLLGVSLQARAGAPGSDAVRDVNQLFSVAAFDRMVIAGEAIGDALDTWAVTGQTPFETPTIGDKFARALMPRTGYRFIQLTRDGAIKSLRTQNQLIAPGEMDRLDRIGFVLGMPPLEMVKAFAASDIQYNDQEDLRRNIEKVGTLLAEAQMAGDPKAVARAYLLAYELGIPTGSIAKSAATRMHKREESDILQRIDKAKALQLRQTFGMDID